MNVLIITDVYIPNANSSAVLMKDLALSLVKKNINVYVLTLRESNTFKRQKEEPVTEEDGVKVLRVENLKKKKVGMIRRGLSEVLLPHLLYRGYRKYLSNVKPDVIICYSPPITLERTVRKLKKKYAAKTYLVLRDVFPQCARDVGALKQDLVFNFFKKIESQLYKVSDYIGVQSLSDLKSVSNNKSISKKKVELLYNWIDSTPFERKIKKDFRREFGLEGKIVCLYAGNIGMYQELDFLMELVKLNKENNSVVFLIVGSGSESQQLRDKYGHLENIVFKDFINPEQYPDLVRQCDIGLINLNRNLTVQNIPGKLMGYWCSRLPVLASINPGNDLLEMMRDANGGLCSITGDLNQYNENFNRLQQDKELREKMGMSGYLYAIQHFSVDNSRERILEHFPIDFVRPDIMEPYLLERKIKHISV
jgi:glycosyltransferase involved in cell wall biosynthesis